MAFLCPSRIGRDTKDRKKKVKASSGFGRITGSDSVDTLIRVGLEKQHGLPADCKLLVLRDFSPLSEDELPVTRGQEVYLLYKDNGWCYVIDSQGREGFIPESFCATVKFKSKAPREKERKRRSSGGSSESNLISDSFDSAGSLFADNHGNQIPSHIDLPTSPSEEEEVQNVYPEVRPFRKASHGQYIALFDFRAAEENDVNVERAELFEVLNIEDPDWSWIRKYNGQEGFVPKSFICPVEPLRIQERISNLETSAAQIQYHATPLIRQPLLAHDPHRRFQHSTPQPSHKFPLRPSTLSVSKCFNSETNVSDLRKERSALKVHDCSHKERLERNAKTRSRPTSPAVSDRTELKTKPSPSCHARSSSTATSDRSKLRVSCHSLNEEQIYSRATSYEQQTKHQRNSLSTHGSLPLTSISPILDRYGSVPAMTHDGVTSDTPPTNSDPLAQFCPSLSSSRRPSLSLSIKENNDIEELNDTNRETCKVVDIDNQSTFRNGNNEDTNAGPMPQPPSYEYAMARSRKPVFEQSSAMEYNSTGMNNENHILNSSESRYEPNSKHETMDEHNIKQGLQPFQKFNEIHEKLSVCLKFNSASGRRATSQPTSRCVSPTSLKENTTTNKEYLDKSNRKIHSNLSSEDYRYMSNTGMNSIKMTTFGQCELPGKSMTKSSSVSNLVAKFNATANAEKSANQRVMFKPFVFEDETQTYSSNENSNFQNQNNQSNQSSSSFATDYNQSGSSQLSSFKPNSHTTATNENVPPQTKNVQGITELIMLYDYKSQNSDGLFIRRGETVYVDNPDQYDQHWLWIFHPAAQKYGYVPRDYVKSTMLKTTL